MLQQVQDYKQLASQLEVHKTQHPYLRPVRKLPPGTIGVSAAATLIPFWVCITHNLGCPVLFKLTPGSAVLLTRCCGVHAHCFGWPCSQKPPQHLQQQQEWQQLCHSYQASQRLQRQQQLLSPSRQLPVQRQSAHCRCSTWLPSLAAWRQPACRCAYWAAVIALPSSSVRLCIDWRAAALAQAMWSASCLQRDVNTH